MKNLLCYFWISLLFLCCQPSDHHYTQTHSSNGYNYETVTNDPTNTRIYTLDNGLKVYLSHYEDAPRIQVFTAFKAGGKNDPADNTGLAHYLEHMMFKGTDLFGTKDYGAEKYYLDSIEQLFNDYGKLNDPSARKEHYALIDKVSNKAAEFAIPNEYDKMIALLGGKGLNAYTTADRTVYQVDIPSNELERFLTIEGKRFKKIVNRLFHTELEAVYEEKNRSLDNDYSKVNNAINAALFPHHPYGTQSVIGTIEHLKNPSITAINDYFNTYYRPNNAAICMSGDLDYDKTIALIDKHFGDWEPNPSLSHWEKGEATELNDIQLAEVFGPQEERVTIGYRFDGTDSDEHTKVVLIDMLLNNSSAGLIDLNLMQQQKVLKAGSFVYDRNDYSIHTFFGTPKTGQSLEEVQALILAQIDSIKAGAFEPWLLKAVVNDLKKNVMEQEDSGSAIYYRGDRMVKAFTNNTPWVDKVSYFKKLTAITQEELIAFANTHYNNNYAVVYKRNGTDPKAQKIEKPSITKVPLNRNDQSDFHKEITEMSVEKLTPKFLDFNTDLNYYQVGDFPIIHKENNTNDLFELNYVFEFSTNADPKIGIALTGLLEFCGTDSLSPEEVKKEFYKLGSSYTVRSTLGNERLVISLNGLNEHFDATVSLFENLLTNATAASEDLQKLIDRIKKQRDDNLKNKRFLLWNGLYGYAKYGKNNPNNLILSNAELDELNEGELIDIIQKITSYPHRITYYGNLSQQAVLKSLEAHHLSDFTTPLPTTTPLKEKDLLRPKVYWVHYDMVQTEMALLAKSVPYNPAIAAAIQLFNSYFGGGMNSIVFQEIRDAQGLAYAVFSQYLQGAKKDRSNYLVSYVGIQADKQQEALASMLGLIAFMPESESAFDIAKTSILNKLESERITKAKVIQSYLSAQDKGLNEDIRKKIYNEVKELSFDELITFHQSYIKDLPQSIVVIGNRENINFENLADYGEVIELNLADLFNY